MNSELKPCPFCGGEPHIVEDLSIYWVRCDSLTCGVCAKTIPYNTREKAIKAWNTRHDRTCHMTLKKSGPFYDVWYFDCCEKEWAEPRCDSGVVEYPGLVCPWCGAKVVD